MCHQLPVTFDDVRLYGSSSYRGRPGLLEDVLKTSATFAREEAIYLLSGSNNPNKNELYTAEVSIVSS